MVRFLHSRQAGLAVFAAVTVALAQAVGAERNDWYRNSRVWIHCDNHSGLLGQGLAPEALTAMSATVPCAAPGAWQRVTVELRMGVERAGYDVTVAAAGRELGTLKDVPFAQSTFTQCNSIHFVGAGEKQATTWLDNVRFERLPDAP